MAGNTTPIGVQLPTLDAIRVVAASRNKAGVYVTLGGVLRFRSPDLEATVTAPVEFKVSLSEWEASSWGFSVDEQTDNAREFLAVHMVKDKDSTVELLDLYHAYMNWGGTAKRAVFHSVLRTEFGQRLEPADGEYTIGARLVVRGWRPRRD